MTGTGDPTRRRRRLAAILMTDVVGFSRMMGRDDQAATSLILEFLDHVRSAIESHGGRVVGTAGDSVFGDFDSVLEALECAAGIQRHLHRRNAEVPPEERVEARMGLHIGDVIVEEYNVFGDGVNIAARLEQLADPGGIVLSEAVFQQVKGHSDLPIQEIGTRSLKNIEHPVRLYRIGPEALGGEPAERRPATATHSDARAEAIQAVRNAIIGSIRSTGAPDEDAGTSLARDALERQLRSLGQRGEGGDQDDDVSAARETLKRELRSLRSSRRAADEDDPEADHPGERRRGLAAVLGPGKLALVALGVLLILARVTGWSDNGVYPFLGSVFLGAAVGAMLRAATGLRGIGLLLQAAGIATGAAFLGTVAIKALLWVLAAAMLGRSLPLLRRS